MKRVLGLIMLSLAFVLVVLTGVQAEEETQEQPKLKIVVVDFTDSSGKGLTNIGEASVEILGTLLYESDKFDVLERSKLESIITEQGLSMSGLVDSEKSALQIGKLLDADYILTGSVVSFNTKTVNFKGYKIETQKVITEMNVNIKLLNINTGKVEFAGLFPAKDEVVNASASTETTSIDRTLLTKALKSAVPQLVKKVESQTIKVPTKIIVKFDSIPTGADVEIDGVFYGNTPLSVPLNPGIHEVTVSLSGYESWVKKINAIEGLSIKATLAKKQQNSATDDKNETKTENTSSNQDSNNTNEDTEE